MFFTRVHRELWPAAFADPKKSACCMTHYYIGSCVTAHILEQLQTLIPAIEPQDAHYIADETDTTEEDLLLWRWAAACAERSRKRLSASEACHSVVLSVICTQTADEIGAVRIRK